MSTSGGYGVQDDGSFRKKPIDVIREDVKQNFLNELGQDIELRPSSPVMQVINATVIEISKQWDAAEAAYYASFYEDSFGEQLDKQLALAGFRRQGLRGASGEVTFSRDSAATQDITIPAGTVVQAPRTDTKPRIPFETTEDATIFSGQSQVSGVNIEALEPWQTDVDKEYLGEETNLSADTITEFGDPVSGVDSVNNPNPTGDTSLGYTEGRDRESDAEFKLRYQVSLAEAGRATRDGIRSAVFAADDGVASVDIEEIHDTNTDDYGVRVTVLAPGVANDIIAQSIYDSRAAGLESFGAETGNATTESGETVTEQFDLATELPILVNARLTTDSTYETDGDTQISDRLIRYVGGTDLDGLQFPGLGVGESVVYDQTFRRIINQQGVVEVTLFIGVDSPGTEQTTDPDDSTVDDTAERGVRVNADVDIDNEYIEVRLSGNVSGATRLLLRESDGTIVTTVDISDKSAGDWVRIPEVLNYAAGTDLDIGVDDNGDGFTTGYDADPTYPYDGAGMGLSITQRHRQDLSSDGSPQATRPNIDAVRKNNLQQSNISATSTEAPTLESADISIE